MKKAILLLLISCSSLLAQTFNLDTYDWDKAIYTEIEVDDSTNVHQILNKRTLYYYYDENNQLATQYLFHKKFLVNSHDAINDLNQVYISHSEDDIDQFKARVINPSGQVIDISKDKLLKGVDEDSEQQYLYFALEGLEIGSQVEYYFIKAINPTTTGLNIEIQDYDPTERFELDVITPWNLVMAGKVYNMDRTFDTDTSFENQNHIFLHVDSIPAMKDETSAYTDAHLARAVFKLDKNLYTGANNIVAYSHIAQTVVNNLNKELSKKEIKTLAKIEKEIKGSSSENAGSLPRQIENYIKTNFHYRNIGGEEYFDISSIYNNKVYNQVGGLILFTQLFKQLGVEYKLVYTSDRSELPFDPDFASNIYLQTVLIYIPSEKMLMQPTSTVSRMGYVNDLNLHNYALFIEEEDLNGQVVGLASTDFIPAKPADFTIDSLDVRVSFGENLTENSLQIKRTLTGYTAGFYQPLLELIKDPDSKKNFQESILKYIDSESEVSEISIENGTSNLLGIKPLIVKGSVETHNIIETAGNDYLLKVGSLIGPQTEMYSDEGERTLNIETSHARTYYRTIAFEIPEGYEAGGLETLKMDEILTYDNETSGRFISDYSVEGNLVTVSIYEFYNEVEYPKELFEDYRRVINAAADFNKKTVLLKKI